MVSLSPSNKRVGGIYFCHRLFWATTRHVFYMRLAFCDVCRLTYVSIKSTRIHALRIGFVIVILKLGSARIQVDAVGGSQ